jgi:hypothetical protein
VGLCHIQGRYPIPARTEYSSVAKSEWRSAAYIGDWLVALPSEPPPIEQHATAFLKSQRGASVFSAPGYLAVGSVAAADRPRGYITLCFQFEGGVRCDVGFRPFPGFEPHAVRQRLPSLVEASTSQE